MYLASVFLVIVDGVITTVALPSIGRQFLLSPTALDSVVVVYPVCLGTMVPASAWLLERFGGRRILLLGLTLFTLASALCGLSRDLTQLVLFRALQGAAAGVLTPVSQGLLFQTFSQREQVRLARVLIIPQQLAPALAPVLGGVLVDTLGWRWVFLVNLPLGIAAVAFGLAFLDEHRGEEAGTRRLDLTGLLLSAAGLGALMYGVCAGPDLGWGTPAVLGALLGGAALLAMAVRHQWRVRQPALRVRLFEDRMFRRASVLNALGLVPFLGAMFLVPLVVQQLQGRSALDSGTATCTEAVGILLTVQVVGRVYHRVGPGPLVGAGLLGVAAVELCATGTGAGTSLWTFRLVMFLLGLSMGAVFLPLTAASLTTLDHADAAQAATLTTVTRQTSAALAPAVVTAAVVLGTTSGRTGTPPAGAYRLAFLALGLIALFCAAYGFRLGRPGRPSPASAAGSPRASAASASRTSRLHLPRSRRARPQPPRDDRAPAGRAGSSP
jgi:EmrB/QacA subfamily drug resistance transporter